MYDGSSDRCLENILVLLCHIQNFHAMHTELSWRLLELDMKNMKLDVVAEIIFSTRLNPFACEQNEDIAPIEQFRIVHAHLE